MCMAYSEMRDTEKNPYSKDERRVATYLWELFEGKIGAGDDPIGFLIASHRELVRRLKQKGTDGEAV